MRTAWRNVSVEEIDGHWHAKGEYYNAETGKAIDAFDTTFVGCSASSEEEHRRATLFVSRIVGEQHGAV